MLNWASGASWGELAGAVSRCTYALGVMACSILLQSVAVALPAVRVARGQGPHFPVPRGDERLAPFWIFWQRKYLPAEELRCQSKALIDERLAPFLERLARPGERGS
jgi:hypothetical protein